MITIEEYNPLDKAIVIKFMERLQDYLVALDPMRRLKRESDYGKKYTELLLSKVLRNNGRIFIAKYGEEPAGLIAGIIEKQSKEDLIAAGQSKTARIVELFVDDAYRSKGIGKMLMEKIEEFFTSLGCEIVRIEVFEPNKNAHQFYQNLGYQNRMIDLIKKL